MTEQTLQGWHAAWHGQTEVEVVGVVGQWIFSAWPSRAIENRGARPAERRSSCSGFHEPGTLEITRLNSGAAAPTQDIALSSKEVKR